MKLLLLLFALMGLVTAQNVSAAQNASLAQDNTLSTDGLVANTTRYNTILRVDNGTYGPTIEEVHYYYSYWPIGIAVASDGRIFTSYTRGTYNYTVAVIVNTTAEAPYPSADIQLSPSALNTTFNGIAFGSANSTGLISVQALWITPASSTRPETLWLLDTGRPTVQASDGTYSIPYSQPGGPKIVAVSLSNDSVYATYTFPPTVHYPDSYMNDLRFDLRANVSGTSGHGIAYIVDSSNDGRPGFIMLDLGTGESWRRLDQHPSVLRTYNNVPTYQGHPFYYRNPNQPVSHQQEGLDGISLTPDGEYIYYSPLDSENLYRVPSANLRGCDPDPLAEQAASNNVSWLGQRGGEANGFEGDSHGLIYQLVPTQNALLYYDPRDLQTHGFVRDPRLLWPDGASIGADGYIYLNVNQLPYQPEWNNGIDERVYPGAILRARLPNGGTKISTLQD